MQVKMLIDKKYKSMEIHVCNDEKNASVIQMVKDIEGFVNIRLPGTDTRGEKVMLNPQEIIRFYAQNQKVMAQDAKGVYSVQKKLYELEQLLDTMDLFRISKSEIINLRKVRSLDINMAGTIKVILIDGTETYTSRRNVTRLKKKLGLK